MKALLDTHTLLWGLDGDPRLSAVARDWIADADHVILVSAASAWEIATKVRIGKLPGADAVVDRYQQCLKEQVFTPLAISTDHALRAGSPPPPTAIPSTAC